MSCAIRTPDGQAHWVSCWRYSAWSWSGRVALIPGFDLYPVGALIFVSGMIALCGSAWIARTLAVWVPAAFVVSTLLGLVGTVADNSGWLFVLSGVLFGAAFAGLGREVWLAADSLIRDDS